MLRLGEEYVLHVLRRSVIVFVGYGEGFSVPTHEVEEIRLLRWLSWEWELELKEKALSTNRCLRWQLERKRLRLECCWRVSEKWGVRIVVKGRGPYTPWTGHIRCAKPLPNVCLLVRTWKWKDKAKVVKERERLVWRSDEIPMSASIPRDRFWCSTLCASIPSFSSLFSLFFPWHWCAATPQWP